MAKGLDYLINLKEGTFGGAKRAKDQLTGLDDAVAKTGKNVDGLGSIVGRVGGIMATAFAIGGIISFGAQSLAAYQAGFVKASAQVNAAIVSTGGVAGKTLDGLRAQADDLEKRTLFGDDAILTSQSLLLTFTNIKGEIYDQAIPAIADMAQRMAGDGPADMKGASIQVGKALNDPIKGINALSRVGVSFTESQKATITSMVQQNNVAGAQALILKELNAEFGGSAEAARQALGPQGDYNYLMGETMEAVGSLVQDGMNVLLPAVNNVVMAFKSGVEWIKENKDLLVAVGEVVLYAGGAYLLYQGYLLALQAPLLIMTAAQWALNVAMTANPIGIIVVAIGALIGGLIIAYKKSENFRASLDGLIEVGKLIGRVYMGVGKTIIGAFTFNKDLFLEGIKDTAKVTEEILGGGISKAFNKGFDASKSKSKIEADKEAQATTMDKLATKPLTKPGILPGGGGAGNGNGAGGTSLSSNKQVRNVQVTIGKLVENLTVATTNMQGAGAADIKRMITEVLTAAVHDSELALSNG